MAEGQVRILCDPLHQSVGRTVWVKGEEVDGEDEALVMAVSALADPVNNLLVDKHALPAADGYGTIQQFNNDLALQHIDELQILVPVHHQKAGISGKTVFVYYIQN